MRTGVGSKPLHGLFTCGQLDTTTSTSRSARRSTHSPGAEIPSTIPRRAVGVDGHVHEPVDVRLQVALAEAVAAQLVDEVLHAGVLGGRCGTRSAGAFDSFEQAPPIVSWRAHDVPVIVIIGLPSVEQQHAALDEEDVALGDHRVRGAVALHGVVGVVAARSPRPGCRRRRRSAASGRPSTTCDHGARARTTSSCTTGRRSRHRAAAWSVLR